MAIDINKMSPSTGRILKEDSNTINIADLSVPEEHTFHDGVTDISVPNGLVYNNVHGRNEMTFDIAGTSTSQAYEFRGIGPAGNDNLITCFRATDWESGTGTSVKGETWQATITGLVTFYVKLISLEGGTGIVKGNASK